MKCNSCQSIIPDNSTTCPVCGADTAKDFFNDVKQLGRSRRDVLLLLLYISWGLFGNIIFFLINQLVFRRTVPLGARQIGALMSAVNIMVASIDVVFIIVLLILLKSRQAKGFFIAFLVIRVLIFVLNTMSSR